MPTAYEYTVECPTCQQRQLATEKAEYANEYPWDPEPFTRFAITECKMCYSILVVKHQMHMGEDYSEKRSARTAAQVIWPQVERTLSAAIPEAIRREHHEARSCFKVGSYTAVLVMVRRTLEGVCRDHDVTVSPLYKALEEMKRLGLIEGRLLDWAQELRVLGNEAAHFTGRPVARQDAQDSLELAEALMDYLYVFTARFNEFKKRRVASSASGDFTEPSAAPSAAE
ncbi:DUF4145 domain-containing protein [Microbispora sp. NPDC046933]|uniref:DUF4145 domain-containing protein n=1 Tax=Microbispora sp. NPDC046933 TaxID=3155618 RepID=UPI0033FCA862